MAIDDEHPDYEAYENQWEKLRDCAAGQDVIVAKGKKYLPRLSGQTDEEYKAYLTRPVFYGATARTIDGLSGMIFRQPPQYEVPTGFEKMLKDVTLDGTDLLGFAEEIVDDAITVGRGGILVDHPSVNAGTTVAQAEAANIRPFLKEYDAEQIFNWRVESRNNAQVLTQLRLWEWVEVPGGEFDQSCRKQIRVLDFDDMGRYRQRVFIKVKFPRALKEEWIQHGSDIIPLKNGEPLSVIPFFFFGVKNGRAEVEKPPLIDLANVNISHFQSTADLEHGAHFTGLPTAVITGHNDEVGDDGEDGEYRIGSATAWVFPEADAKAEFLEFHGQGLGALENRIQKKEEYMAFLGAKMLSPEKKQVEAAATAQIHRLGESSVLASLSLAISKTIQAALAFMCEWAGFPADNLTFKLNKEFLAVQMDAKTLTALLQLWQGGGIAYYDLLDNLKRGEIVQQDRAEDEIRAEIETENPFAGIGQPNIRMQ